MTARNRLLTILATSVTFLWELIHPHVPVFGGASKADQVSLNPQPLPPREGLPSQGGPIA